VVNKILIVGYGSIGQKYYKIIIKRYPKIKVAVYTKQNIFLKNKIKNFIEILSFDPDLTIFCTPSSKRLEILKVLKKTKTHILFEKPLTNNFKRTKKILEKKNTIYKVGYNLRQLKILTKFRSLLNNKKIGKIYSYHIEAGQFLPDWRKRDYFKTVSARKNLGGGVILELSHEIDYAIWLFGKIMKVKSISGKLSNLRIDTEDTSKILLLNENKAIGSINLDFLTRNKKRFCHVVGSKGELILDFNKKNIKYYNNNSMKWSNIYKNNQEIKETYLSQLNEMMKVIKNNKVHNNLGSIQDSKYILKIIEKIKSS